MKKIIIKSIISIISLTIFVWLVINPSEKLSEFAQLIGDGFYLFVALIVWKKELKQFWKYLTEDEL